MKVVLRHEPRGQRTVQEKDVPFFGAPGALEGSLLFPPINHRRSKEVATTSAVQAQRRMPPEGGQAVQGIVIEAHRVDIIDANS
jgi:hypothetical protein